MLAKVRHYVPTESLRNIYFGIFSSILTYAAQVWGQYHNNHIKRIIKLQNKAIRIINFADFRAPVPKLYQKLRILTFEDTIKVNNYLYVHNSMSRRLPLALRNNFKYLHDNHNHYTRSATDHCVCLPKYCTTIYGIHSITDQAARIWNHLQVNRASYNLHLLSREVCKVKLKAHFIQSY